MQLLTLPVLLCLQNSWNFQDALGSNNCSIAHSTYTYDYYTGSKTYLQARRGRWLGAFAYPQKYASWCIQARPESATLTWACMLLQVQNTTFYVKSTPTNKWAWYPASCATAYDYICELHTSLWTCPPSPPPAAPVIDTEDVDLCRSRVWICRGIGFSGFTAEWQHRPADLGRPSVMDSSGC